ncbi:MAG: bacillithiol biosynthesis deacetylase BshB1 [Chitinophagaceae bacterium]|nr:bacillithiol biosynthesis deacetylase BshB1 [Chitinophagaceae bacterium]
MKLDILAIAAHPDDVELSCAGTLMMEKARGKRVGIADLTRGELGTRGTPETRAQEAADALAVMGLDVRVNLELPDGFFENTRSYQLEVIKAIRRFQPAIVLTNAPTDRHPDHGRAAQLVKDAAWLSGLRKIETQWEGQAQVAWRPAYVFHFIQDRWLEPDFVFDISPVMEQKLSAIRAFKTQFDTLPDDEPQTYISTPGFLQSIIDRARMTGKLIGVAYAEGFISEKKLGVENFDAFIQHVT